MSYKNYMEDAVIIEFDELLEIKKNICTCIRCREDIIAYALNRLPAKYVVTQTGAVFTNLEQFRAQSRADITIKLIEAVKKVKAHPRHNKNGKK